MPVEQNHYWEANGHLNSQDISLINAKQTFIAKLTKPATGNYLSQLNPVHIITTCFFEMFFY
jgi:hypothetical protein